MVSSFLNFYILYLNIDAKRVVVSSFRDSSSRCYSVFLPIKVVWVMGSLITGSMETNISICARRDRVYQILLFCEVRIGFVSFPQRPLTSPHRHQRFASAERGAGQAHFTP